MVTKLTELEGVDPTISEQIAAIRNQAVKLREALTQQSRIEEAIDKGLVRLHWLNIDLQEELTLLLDDLRLDTRSRPDPERLRQFEALQDVNAAASAAVTLLLQASSEDADGLATRRPLIANSVAEAQARARDLPPRADYLTLNQAIILLSDEANSASGVLRSRTLWLQQEASLTAIIDRLGEDTATLHQQLLATSEAERTQLLAASDALNTRLATFLAVLLAGSVLFVGGALGFFGLYVRPRLIRPLQDVTGALRNLAEGRTEPGDLADTGWDDEVTDLSRATERFRRSVIERQAAITQLMHEVEDHRVTLAKLQDTQEELVHAGKLAVLGEMSAGLNHELNQPLMSMQHHLHALQDMASKDDSEAGRETRAEIDRLVRLSRRMSGIVQHLKRFARHGGAATLGPISLRNAAEGAFQFVAHRFENNAINYETDLPIDRVMADQTLVEQVILNLLANALDSVEADTSDQAGQITVRSRAAGGQVHLIIEDNGAGLGGVSPDDALRPFFTTKPQGHGLGLGLSISRRIVEELGGTLELCATEDGARATLSLKEAAIG